MELASPREAELKEQGWTRMFTVEVARVPEYVETYEETGVEVLVEIPTALELDPQCMGCYDALKDLFRTIYTRAKSADGG